jgi:acyl-[acyl-carrier-protein] desaturase
VGDTVTEEALPSYQTMTNRHAGITDETGASDSPWARWTRGWTAEENRHGQLLSGYLYLTGRVDMRAVERTTQYLLRNGFDPGTRNDPYCGLIYTSFQERATRVSHGNVARLANTCGDSLLGKICNLVAGDEARHEEAYKRFVGEVIARDPAGAVIACAAMMKRTVTMPAERMADGTSQDLFGQFAAVAQRLGVYTVRDYADILEHLMTYWRVPQITGLHGEAAACQDYLGTLVGRYRAFAEKVAGRRPARAPAPFSWIFGRSA